MGAGPAGCGWRGLRSRSTDAVGHAVLGLHACQAPGVGVGRRRRARRGAGPTGGGRRAMGRRRGAPDPPLSRGTARERGRARGEASRSAPSRPGPRLRRQPPSPIGAEPPANAHSARVDRATATRAPGVRTRASDVAVRLRSSTVRLGGSAAPSGSALRTPGRRRGGARILGAEARIEHRPGVRTGDRRASRQQRPGPDGPHLHQGMPPVERAAVEVGTHGRGDAGRRGAGDLLALHRITGRRQRREVGRRLGAVPGDDGSPEVQQEGREGQHHHDRGGRPHRRRPAVPVAAPAPATPAPPRAPGAVRTTQSRPPTGSVPAGSWGTPVVTAIER